MIKNGIHKGFGLYAPSEYFDLPETERENYTNGCGPKKFGFLVPETVWGLLITPA